MSEYEIRCIEYGSRYAISIAEPDSPIAKIALVQNTDSLRANFFKRLLARRKVKRQFRYFLPLLVYELSKHDYVLFKLASQVPASSSIWKEAIAKIERGASIEEIINFLELNLITNKLGVLEVIFKCDIST